MITLESTTYLGPARVLQAAAGRIKLELPDEHAWALCALAFPYRPEIGDLVLAVGKSAQWYVIGVLKGSGMTTLVAPGDMTLATPRGRLVLEAADGIEMRGPSIRVATNRWEVIANNVTERFVEAVRWVRGAFQIRAGRLRTRVEGAYDMQAESIREIADQDVRIDGKSIDLG